MTEHENDTDRRALFVEELPDEVIESVEHAEVDDAEPEPVAEPEPAPAPKFRNDGNKVLNADGVHLAHCYGMPRPAAEMAKRVATLLNEHGDSDS